MSRAIALILPSKRWARDLVLTCAIRYVVTYVAKQRCYNMHVISIYNRF